MSDLVLESPGRVVSLPLDPTARSPGAGEVLVEVRCISLCGSDYKLFEGAYGGPRQYPIRFGHEWAGRVVAVPAGSALRPGDRVTGDCSRWCGGCGGCRVDRNLCARIEKFGITRDGFSTRYRLVDERYLYRDTLGLEEGALALVEPFAVALRGIQRAGGALETADQVLVIGGGPIGLATYLLLKDRHPGCAVHLSEAIPERRDCIHQRFPEVDLAQPHPGLPAGQSLSYGELSALARYPVVFECSGAPAGLDAALLLATMRGTVVCFGLGAPAVTRTDLLVSKGLTLLGSIGGTGGFEESMRFLSRRPEVAGRMVTHRYPAHQAQRAFDETKSSASRIKVQLQFRG